MAVLVLQDDLGHKGGCHLVSGHGASPSPVVGEIVVKISSISPGYSIAV